MYKNISRISMVLTAILLLAIVALAAEKSGEEINWQVISSGGTNGFSTNFGLLGTISQTAVGPGSSPSFRIHSGFWQDFEGSPSVNCCDTPGDASNNGAVNILDVTYLIAYLYSGGPAPVCMYEGDANGNCAINILDITYLIAYLYTGGSAPTCASDCPGW